MPRAFEINRNGGLNNGTLINIKQACDIKWYNVV